MKIQERVGGGRLTRRKFLAAGAVAAVAMPYIIPASALGRDGSVAASERINVGFLGLGGKGNDHLRSLLNRSKVQVVAGCDADMAKAEAAVKRANGHYAEKTGNDSYDGIKAYQDFREILARPDIDAVVIAAPENWHALMAIAAMKAGKDVYCEKALTLTVAEGRAVCETVRRYGRVFQAGTQQRSSRQFRFACELARNGYLGKVHTVQVGVPGGRQLPDLEVAPPPANLDYDIWLGPAPYKPHRNGMCSFNWYFIYDYCAGWIQSWGVHHCDIALWGAPELHASTLDVEGTAVFPKSGTADTSITWQTKLTTPGGLVYSFCDNSQPEHGQGCRFIGDKGWVHVNRGGIHSEPASLLRTVLTPSDEHLYESNDHHDNFIDCILNRRDPVAPVEACHRATTISLVADIATRMGRKLKWDWNTERFINDEAANRLLSRTMRSPWHV